jgi:crotonobetainyl-CoA:carnitine CoA-transferase CaiB-like acyl-CoA transferase
MADIAGEPRYAPTILADKICGHYSVAHAMTAALFARERTGRGQFVETPMFESMVAFVLMEHLFGHAFAPPLAPLGYTRVLGSCRRPYKTKDGYLCMLAYTDRHWQKFGPMVGKAQICQDPRFASVGQEAATSARFTSSLAAASPRRPRTNAWRCCASGKFQPPPLRASTT